MKDRNRKRYEHMLQEELSKLILREVEMKPGILVTITRVEVSGDFDYARIYVSILPDKFQGTALTELRSKHKELAFLLGDILEKGRIPHLDFQIDQDIIEAYHIDTLLDQLGNDNESSHPKSS